jgi:uncharacterized membrane protein
MTIINNNNNNKNNINNIPNFIYYKKYMIVTYLFVGLLYFTFLLTGFIAVCLAYSRRDNKDIKDTYMYSHFNQLIYLFWTHSMWFCVVFIFSMIDEDFGSGLQYLAFLWLGINLIRGFKKFQKGLPV